MSDLLKKRDFSLFLIIILIVIIVSLRAPRFLAVDNAMVILEAAAILMMVAIGQLMVIVTGGIDLSVGSVLALTGMSVALLNQYHPGIPIFAIVLISIAIGFLLGSLNGILVAHAKIPPIITTLGTMSIYRGLVFVISGGRWVSAHELSEAFIRFPRETIFGISTLIIIPLLIAILFSVFLYLTKTGREIYGVGGNKIASQYVGISLNKINYLVFAISGAISGLAGFLWVARFASASSGTAFGFELQTVAACVIGGASILGGCGTILGVMLGALFIAMTHNALILVGISPFWQLGMQGFLIVLAITLNTYMDKRNQRLVLRRRTL